jgi:hypothetical protein
VLCDHVDSLARWTICLHHSIARAVPAKRMPVASMRNARYEKELRIGGAAGKGNVRDSFQSLDNYMKVAALHRRASAEDA